MKTCRQRTIMGGLWATLFHSRLVPMWWKWPLMIVAIQSIITLSATGNTSRGMWKQRKSRCWLRKTTQDSTHALVEVLGMICQSTRPKSITIPIGAPSTTSPIGIYTSCKTRLLTRKMHAIQSSVIRIKLQTTVLESIRSSLLIVSCSQSGLQSLARVKQITKYMLLPKQWYLTQYSHHNFF